MLWPDPNRIPPESRMTYESIAPYSAFALVLTFVYFPPLAPVVDYGEGIMKCGEDHGKGLSHLINIITQQ